jgi:hypothetical protein
MLTPIALLLLLFCGCATPARAVDLAEIEKMITGPGMEGEIHGADAARGLFVITYRNPKDFFDYLEMSLVPANAELAKQLGPLQRHDRVKIKGTFLKNPSPQKHIEVTSLEMVQKFQSPYPADPYGYEARVPDELLNQSSALFLVHAVHADGHILVVEYKDAVLPIFVNNGELTRKLFRNDLVRLSFHIQKKPKEPTHLKLNETAPDALELVESIQARHGQPAQIEGALVLFPKSPQVLFNVFAVLEELPAGLKRQYTLVNFDSPEEFKRIRDKLQAAWDSEPKAYVNGRNKLVSTAIRVRVKGKWNEVDPNQANAQVLLDSADSVEILKR